MPHRRSAPKVVDGRVQEKNNWTLDRNAQPLTRVAIVI
jgi:hypothetical protein